MKYALLALLALACSTSAARPDGVSAGAVCTQQACVDNDAAAMKGSYVTATKLTCCSYLRGLTLAALVSAAGCGVLPKPVDPSPGGAGGMAGVAGAPAEVNGYALCVAAAKANADRKRQATDNGITISTLAADLCAPVQVQTCFASGVCQ